VAQVVISRALRGFASDPSGSILALYSGGFGSLIRRAPYDGQITAWLVQVRLRLPSGDLALQGTHRLILRHQGSTAQPDAFSASLSPRKLALEKWVVRSRIAKLDPSAT
jgi:hypothetical protein